ncbi:glycosyltransferase family 87 protein [Acidocella sp.]|uniref:glycosyltransferase family 87 protein n=1 Tax=Acidocella sp. TaxID=50710 RepID=UPI003D04EED1
MRARFLAYARLIDRLGGTLLLLAFWGGLLFAFALHMAPRLAYLTGAPIGDDLPCHTPECDFGVFWPAGILARAGAFSVLYDHARFGVIAASMLNTHGYIEHFLYPPTMLPLMGGISFLPFEQAAFVWMFGQLLLAAILLRVARFSWPVILAALFSPAALFGTEIGQIGVICGACLVCGLVLANRNRQAAGGLLLGILAMKPQVGILVPFALMVRRQWRGLLFFVLAALGLCLLATAWFGTAPWRAFLAEDHAEIATMLNRPFDPHTYQGWGVSSFWMARGFGAGVELARFIQAAVIALSVAALYVLRRRANFVELVVYLSLLASPYGFAYGMVGFSLMLADSARQRGWRIGLLDAALFLWPGLCLVVSIATERELTPLIVLAALLRTALPARPPVLPAPAQE